MKRRSFLGMIGVAPVAGQALGLEGLAAPTQGYSGRLASHPNPLWQNQALDAESQPMDDAEFKRTRVQSLIEAYKGISAARIAAPWYEITRLDPDINAMRSISDTGKMIMQHARMVERAARQERNGILRELFYLDSKADKFNPLRGVLDIDLGSIAKKFGLAP